jgi:hypothetical protein
MLLSLDPKRRPSAEQLLGVGGGRQHPHRFLFGGAPLVHRRM